MASEKKRFVFYRPKPKSEALVGWPGTDPMGAVIAAFVSGELRAGKSADDLEKMKDGEIALDTDSGKLCIQIDGKRRWARPSHPCPDCDGELELKKKFFRVGNPASPWFYICSKREDAGCKSVMPANKGGDMSGVPADAETRRARKLTNEQFDRLWQEAPDILEWADDPAKMKPIVNKAKARAYRFLADQMTSQDLEGNINKMNIETLRVAYKICKTADLNEVMKFG